MNSVKILIINQKYTGYLVDKQYYKPSGKVCEIYVPRPRPRYINSINLPFRLIIQFIYEVTSVFLPYNLNRELCGPLFGNYPKSMVTYY